MNSILALEIGMSDLIDIKDKILIKAKMVSLEMELLKLSIHDGFKEMKTNQVFEDHINIHQIYDSIEKIQNELAEVKQLLGITNKYDG